MLGVGLALRVRPIHVAGLLQRAISMQQLPRSSCDSETRLHPCGQIRSFAQKDDSTRDGLVEQQQEKRSGGLVARRTKEETAALIEKLRSRCAISFSLVVPERNVRAICWQGGGGGDVWRANISGKPSGFGRAATAPGRYRPCHPFNGSQIPFLAIGGFVALVAFFGGWLFYSGAGPTDQPIGCVLAPAISSFS